MKELNQSDFELEIIQDLGTKRIGSRMIRTAIFKCSCGNHFENYVSRVKSGYVKSCGCMIGKQIQPLDKKYGDIEVVQDLGIVNGDRKAIFKCYCGNNFETFVSSVKNKNTRSCGCLRDKVQKEIHITHGYTTERKKHELYNRWHRMVSRCNSIKNSDYKDYGARGILVCKEWLDFSNFVEWAYSSGYEQELTIERVNNDGDYTPQNCIWATRKVQANNTRRSLKNKNKLK